MTTIGGKNDHTDLQSLMGYALTPPPQGYEYHPRPVHRLDRQTSGLILVAKTQKAMQVLSKAFVDRTVTKTYSAIVFEAPHAGTNGPFLCANHEKKKEEWCIVDYPIDGKPAISSWRMDADWLLLLILLLQRLLPRTILKFRLHLLQIRPHTGRTHQIRRHLSYCLGMPFVGDAKYDKGVRELRGRGIYLCCHDLEFPYPFYNEIDSSTIASSFNDFGVRFVRDDDSDDSTSDEKKTPKLKVSIPVPLPRKFQYRLNNS
jgi:23S rRNA-/tRNA-specific pseudouridylate synthase